MAPRRPRGSTNQTRHTRAVFQRESGMLFTEDDLLWYRLKPTQTSPLDFSYGDRAVAFAQGDAQPVFGAHLVWDQGLGDGWPPDQLYT